ncbi:hypothetical protein ACH5RR_001476 [Cinchona calisaya]|uniref:Retrotransposon gag domain-containing protein n=1 Tax=Cinchona calisaya TaxID=153742 RepID=A0ABD3B3I7_9GENT
MLDARHRWKQRRINVYVPPIDYGAITVAVAQAFNKEETQRVPPLQKVATSRIKVHYKATKNSDTPTFEGGPNPPKPFLVGEATNWCEGVEYALMEGGQPVIWVQFKEALPPSLPSQKITEFHNLTQTSGMSVVEYAYKFQTLGIFVPTIMNDDKLKAYNFKKGL